MLLLLGYLVSNTRASIMQLNQSNACIDSRRSSYEASIASNTIGGLTIAMSTDKSTPSFQPGDILFDAYRVPRKLKCYVKLKTSVVEHIWCNGKLHAVRG